MEIGIILINQKELVYARIYAATLIVRIKFLLTIYFCLLKSLESLDNIFFITRNGLL